MHKRKNNLVFLTLILIASLITSGCTIAFRTTPPEEVKRARQLKQRVRELTWEMDRLKEMKEKHIRELSQAKITLEGKLYKELKAKEVQLELMEKGLVITFLAEILFDPGSAKIRPEVYEALDKVAVVLKEELVDKNIGIEGHTDNQPIKYSGWKSNWELSAGRAISVLHYLVDERGIRPERISARGYGEYHPVASNDTQEGRQLNRRVEIVVLPEAFPKVKAPVEVPVPEEFPIK